MKYFPTVVPIVTDKDSEMSMLWSGLYWRQGNLVPTRIEGAYESIADAYDATKTAILAHDAEAEIIEVPVKSK